MRKNNATTNTVSVIEKVVEHYRKSDVLMREREVQLRYRQLVRDLEVYGREKGEKKLK